MSNYKKKIDADYNILNKDENQIESTSVKCEKCQGSVSLLDKDDNFIESK